MRTFEKVHFRTGIDINIIIIHINTSDKYIFMRVINTIIT